MIDKLYTACDDLSVGSLADAYKTLIRVAASVRGEMNEADRRSTSLALVLEADDDPSV